MRIVKYRESLEGFVAKAQENEVNGLDSTVVKNLLNRSYIEMTFQPVRLNINTASEKELDRHPYFN
jgi:competence protein ComEA